MPVIASNHHHNSKEGVHMIINTNTGAATAARILSSNTRLLQDSLKRLSTGSKIASVEDDAAGLAVANKLEASLRRTQGMERNSSNLISFAQTQDGYLEQVGVALNRMSELATLAMDQTLHETDRAHYDTEFDELDAFVQGIVTKEFNGISLFNGNSLSLMTGLAADGTVSKIEIEGYTLGSGTSYEVAGNTGIDTVDNAITSLDKVQLAVLKLAQDRASIGSNIQRMEQERSALETLRNNLGAARSQIIDVDVAQESANFAKQQILVQSGTAMLAQANVLPQSALRLIG
jgi:flagellin